MYNYKYITAGNKVIALSTYAGKAVRGIAKCAPNDQFDLEKGKDLATARCAHKIARKRMKRALKKLCVAGDELKQAQDFYEQMRKYYKNACLEVTETENAVATFANM